jgi:hypothetical protein
MAKACRVLRSAKAPHAPRAAHVAKPLKKGGGAVSVAKPAAASHKSKVHHRKLKKHHVKAKGHARKVCGMKAPGA